MSPTTASHAGGINMIENPRRIGHKPKFPCRLCNGGHLTRLCLAIVVVQEAQSLSDSPLGSESSLVFQHPNPYLVDTSVMMMQYSVDSTLIFGGDASLDHVVSHHVQPTVLLMQSSTETNPVFWGDVSLNHVVSHPIQPTVEEVVMPMQS
jgi:hypothetical protein